jgi:hypothetical protein
MIEFLSGVGIFVIRAIDFVLYIVLFFSRLDRLARWATGSDAIVEVPPEPKILSPAARRALAEAERRRKANNAAKGTVRES